MLWVYKLSFSPSNPGLLIPFIAALVPLEAHFTSSGKKSSQRILKDSIAPRSQRGV